MSDYSNESKDVNAFIRKDKIDKFAIHRMHPVTGVYEIVDHYRTLGNLSMIAKPRDPWSRVISKGTHRGKKVSTFTRIPGTTDRSPIVKSEYVNRMYQHSLKDARSGQADTGTDAYVERRVEFRGYDGRQHVERTYALKGIRREPGPFRLTRLAERLAEARRKFNALG